MKRTLTTVVSLLGLFILVVAARVVWSARSELLKAKHQLEQGRTDRAILHFRRAAHWYAPGNPYSRAALEQLWTIGKEAEGRGQRQRALLAYRAIRSSILAARSFYTPHKVWLARANERIAVLMARQRIAQEGSAKKSAANYDHLKGKYLHLLERSSLPSVFWSLVALLGLALWIGSGFAFAYRAIDAEDRLQTRPAIFWGCAILLGLAVWLAGLALA